MASYHCTVKAGGKGRAGPHSDYIEREGKYAPELAQGKSKLEDLEYKASGNMPAWAEHDAGIFWRAADEHERANGATYREIEVALPRELNTEQRIALVEDFINQQIGKGHAFTFAIHIPKAAIEKGDQPHAHIMYSERTLDGIDRDPEQYFKRANTKNPEKGGCKKDSAGTKERLLATRELWATVQNAHLEKAGCEDRVSHLSLKARGIDRQPEKHLGPIDAKKINAPALVESRTAERALDQARAELAAIDVAAELAAAQAQAAAAARDLEIATLAKQEKEDESIRAKTLAALGRSSAATGRAIAFTGADHAAVEKSLDASGAAGIETKRNLVGSEGCLVASAEHLTAVQGVTRGIGRNTEIAAKGAERRVARSHLESSVTAVGKQLGSVNHVLQQLVDRLPAIVKSIASASRAVVQQFIDRAAKAPERPPVAAPVAAKAITAVAQEKPPAVVLDPALTEADRKLIVRLDDAIERAAKGDPKAMNSIAGDLDKLADARSAALSDYGRVMPQPFHVPYAKQDAKAQREAAAKIDVNAAAVARGITAAVPYPPGTEGLYTAQHYSSYETALKKAVSEVGHHSREPRPEGFFNKKATAAYDAKTADLQSKAAGWEREIGWRDGALKAASAAREPQDAAHVARAKAIHDQEQAPAAAKAEPLRARHAAHEREHARIRDKIERLFDKDKQRELDGKERSRGLGR